jgi:membrane-bound ClpP family serine protease
MELLSVLLLVLLGVVLLIVEFMLIPGISIAGVGCFISFAFSVFLSFRYFGLVGGFVTLAVIVILVPILLYLIFRSRTIKKMMLSSDIDGKVKTVDDQLVHPGDNGITVGRLAPGGKVRINGSAVEARSLGQYIDPGTQITVVKIEGNIVIVKPIS